ncbi:MAG: hypothetical protein Q9162_002223 [Coniocarpon cinnabarinum]
MVLGHHDFVASQVKPTSAEMRLRAFLLSGSSLIGSAVATFQDTAPFLALLPSSFSFSTAVPTRFASAGRVHSIVDDIAKQCPTSSYVVVSQPAFAADEHASCQPHLQRRSVSSDTSKSDPTKLFIPEVVGSVNADEIAATIHNVCGGNMIRLNGSDGTVPAWQGDHHVVRLEFPALIDRQPEARRKELVRNDAVLNAVLTSLEDGASVSVLFTTTPAHSPVDGARTSSNAGHTKSHLDQNQHPMQVVDFDVEDSADQSLHVAWKRNTDGHIPAHSSTREPSSNETNSNAGLFEKYNYLSAVREQRLMQA